MARDPRALLWDAQASGEAIERFLAGKTFDGYLADEVLRSAMERQFEILGEALSQLDKQRPDLVARLPGAAKASKTCLFPARGMPMTTMIAEVHDASKSAGAEDDKARAAAQAIAEYSRDITELKGSLTLLKWMVGFNLAFTMAVVWQVFT